MLQNWFILIPEITWLVFIVAASGINRWRMEKTPKTFFTLLRYFLAVYLLFTAVFYNRSAFAEVWQNTPLATLFKVFAGVLLLAWSYPAAKWFLNKNRPSYKFCCLLALQFLGFDILAAANSLTALTGAIVLICCCNYWLIYRHWDEAKVRSAARMYAIYRAVFAGLAGYGAGVLMHYAGGAGYEQVKNYFLQNNDYGWPVLTGVAGIVAAVIFLLALAPFHIWFVNFIRVGILPVSGYITIVPPLIYFGALINLMRGPLAGMSDFAMPMLEAAAAISLLLGAISAGGEKNIRCFFGYISIYCLGFALLGMMDFSTPSIIASFAYIIVALLSLAGVYTVFSGLKSHSEYLSELEALQGFYHLRPYMAAALMIFMFSLMGLAPTLGFVGYLAILNNLTAAGAIVRLGALAGGILLAAAACLKIVRTIYFMPQGQKYDRADKTVYVCLFINMAIVVISLIFPAWLMRDALTILLGMK